MLSLKNLSVASAVASALFVSNAQANTATPVHGTSHVTWTKSASGDLSSIKLSDRTAAAVFIRPKANGDADSSTNIGLGGRFLTSLQDGHYSVGVVCAGDVRLSAIPTSAKINDLDIGAATINLKAGEVQYFVVGVGQNHSPNLTQVNVDEARKLISTNLIYKQNHQISRVQPQNCPAPEPKVVEKVVEVPVIVEKVVEVPVKEVYYIEKRPNQRLNILFDFDKSTIKPKYQNEVAKAAQFLSQYPKAKVIVEGHTDDRGSDAYNQALSQRRAEAVRQALISKHGVAANRISAEGFGESRPVADNKTAEGREQNRRVIVVIPNEDQK